MNKFEINLILNDIRSALNVGAIFRTCDATAIKHLYLTGITPYPPHNRIPKTALGAIDTVNWSYHKKIDEVIDKVKNENQKIYAIELSDNAKSLFDFKFEYPCSLVLGNEISGVDPKIMDIVDEVIYIPMFGTKESLNVATTAGIVLYEAVKQLTTKST